MVSLVEALVFATGVGSPVFYLHPDEIFFPSRPLSTSYEFRKWCERGRRGKRRKTWDPDTPVYYTAFLDPYREKLACTYWCFYDESQVDVRSAPLGIPDMGYHQGDWEWVGFIANATKQQGTPDVDLDHLQYYLGQHSKGGVHRTVLVNPNMEENHPVFFVARKSHSNYVTTGARTGKDILGAEEKSPLVKIAMDASNVILSNITFDPREKGKKWTPRVLPVPEQSWFLNRGKWGNSDHSPRGPIVQIHKIHDAIGIRTPLAFKVSPMNLKFNKGTAFWEPDDNIDTFKVIRDPDGSGHGNHLEVTRVVNATSTHGVFFQELEGNTRDGDVIELRARLNVVGCKQATAPIKIKIIELSHDIEKESEIKFHHDPSKGFAWYDLKKLIEGNCLNTIRFEFHVPGDIILQLNRLEVGIHGDGLIALDRDAKVIKEWKHLWFGKIGESHYPGDGND